MASDQYTEGHGSLPISGSSGRFPAAHPVGVGTSGFWRPWAVAILFFGANRVLNRSSTLILFVLPIHNKRFSLGTQQ